jgi:hypothetical protein
MGFVLSTNVNWMIRSRYMGQAGDLRNMYKTLVRNPEEMRLTERPRLRWEDNIKINPK